MTHSSPPRRVSDLGAGVGHTYTVTFTSATDYTVDVSDSAGNAVYSYAGAGYVAGSSKSIALQGGVQVEMSGQPAIGDTFTIEPASAPAYTAVPTAATGLAIGIPRVADPALADPTNTFAIQDR